MTHVGPLALGLTLTSTFAWASFDVLRKFLVRRVDTAALAVLLSLGQLPMFLIWASIEGRFDFAPGYLLPALGSVCLNVAANVLFLESVRLSPLSTTVPLLSLTPAFAALIGIPLLNEVPTAEEWWGIVLVIAGAFVLNATRADFLRPWQLFSTPVRERGSLFMATVALLWSITPLLDKLALRNAGVGAHAAVLSIGVALGICAYLAFVRRLASLVQVRRAPWLFVFSVLSAVGALGFQLLSVRLMFVSLFEAIKRGVGMSLSVLSGRLFFHEPITIVKVASIVVMTLGVALLV